jgi:hypothetical protein
MKNFVKFYPLGNADTTLIKLDNGQVILFDYANTKNTDDKSDKRCDLPTELNKDVKKDYDVVAFTHADKDHIKRFSEYFYLEHAEKYQDGDRKKINELWVPAAIILETNLDNPEAEILRAEARYRLKNKKRIKVFSKPEKLKDWLKKEGISYDEVSHLLVNAGTLVPGWTLKDNGIEFFVHSPFSEKVDNKEIERNEACLIVQAVFNNAYKTAMILGADADSNLWNDIVNITKYYKREGRLAWDIFHISHHCSYKALNNDDRGKNKTTPTENVKWLFETKGRDKGILISPSLEIPDKYGEVQPPHKEVANYYLDVKNLKNGEFDVTMEHPTKSKPEPIKVIIDDNGNKKDIGLTDEEKKAGAILLTKNSAISGNWCAL